MQLFFKWKYLEITALHVLQYWHATFQELLISWNYRTAYTGTLTYYFCHAGNIWKLLAYIATLKSSCSSNINIWILLHCIYWKTDMQLFQNVLSLETTVLRVLEHWHAASLTLIKTEKYCIVYIATLKCSFSSNENIWILLHCIYCNTDRQLLKNWIIWKNYI